MKASDILGEGSHKDKGKLREKNYLGINTLKDLEELHI